MLDGNQMPPGGAPSRATQFAWRLKDRFCSYLTVEAATAVILASSAALSNVEYTYTLRDLTGVAALQPAREFPVDGAAGEGFTNTGNALVMSPALLTKFLDAAKEIANHAVLLPDGFVFSPHTTRRDWTDDTLAKIRDFYREFTDPRGGDKVNLQGIVFDTNQGGRLPIEKYLAATLAERESLKAKRKSIEQVAGETRGERMTEFHDENDPPVVGLREGAWLVVDGQILTLQGSTGARLFRRGQPAVEYPSGSDLSFLLQPRVRH